MEKQWKIIAFLWRDDNVQIWMLPRKLYNTGVTIVLSYVRRHSKNEISMAKNKSTNL